MCVVNAPFVHPYPGHHFAATLQRPGVLPDTAAGGISSTQQDSIRSDAEGNAEMTGASEVARSSNVSSDASKPRMAEHEPLYIIPPPDHYCVFCTEALLRFWYECQLCPGMRLCPDCSELHLRHPLTTVHQAPTGGDRDLSGRDNHDSEIVTDLVNEDDLEDHLGDDILNTGLWKDDSSHNDVDVKDSSHISEDSGTDVNSRDERDEDCGAEGDTKLRQVSTRNQVMLHNLGPLSVDDFLASCRNAISQTVERAMDEFLYEAGARLR